MGGESASGDETVATEHGDEGTDDEVTGQLFVTPEELRSGQTPSQLREAEIARRTAAARAREAGD